MGFLALVAEYRRDASQLISSETVELAEVIRSRHATNATVPDSVTAIRRVTITSALEPNDRQELLRAARRGPGGRDLEETR